MADSPSRNPPRWLSIDYGSSSRQDSLTSSTSHVRFDEDDDRADRPSHLRPSRDSQANDDDDGLRRRRSSMSMRLDSIKRAGGVNSIENFARSWQRAAGFVEIRTHRPSFVYSEDGDSEHDYRRRDEEAGPQERRSLLREQLQSHGSPDMAIGDETGDEDHSGNEADDEAPGESSLKRRVSSPHDAQSQRTRLAPPFDLDSEANYGSISAVVNESSMRHANQLWHEQQLAGAQEPDKEREPLFVKRVEREDGKVVNVVVGQSTLPQTVFNSVNVLIGIGLLSLPLGFKYAGWLVSMVFLLFSAVVTSYTAKILAKCLDVDGTLITFADLAYISFGPKARVYTSILFVVELIAACVALVVLFADSLDALTPGLGVIEWKIICGLILIPISFVPLRVLSFSSILGILCTLSIVVIVFIDGLLKSTTPGSLRQPAKTYLFPENWWTLPLSFGLLMSPWGGHSVGPSIYRDMRHPRKYGKAVTITWSFTYLLDVSMAIIGLLMFGDGVRDEITSNILATKGYPRALSLAIVALIAIIPVTKIPLNARPIVSTVEIYAGLDPRAISPSQSLVGMAGFTRGILKVSIRILVIVVMIVIAILVPSFDRIMAFLGSALCFSICVILPLSFYLKIFGKEVPLWERVMDYVLLVFSSILAITGTIWAFLPKDSIGA